MSNSLDILTDEQIAELRMLAQRFMDDSKNGLIPVVCRNGINNEVLFLLDVKGWWDSNKIDIVLDSDIEKQWLLERPHYEGRLEQMIGRVAYLKFALFVKEFRRENTPFNFDDWRGDWI